jgi:uncharacterized protein
MVSYTGMTHLRGVGRGPAAGYEADGYPQLARDSCHRSAGGGILGAMGADDVGTGEAPRVAGYLEEWLEVQRKQVEAVDAVAAVPPSPRREGTRLANRIGTYHAYLSGTLPANLEGAMDLSPFDYTGPLPAERVRGRDELLADLTRRVTVRTPTALLGPRRFGKTSVLGRLAADMTEVASITVDLMPVQSSLDAAKSLLDALMDAEAGVAQEATKISASLGVNLVALRAEIRSTRSSARSDPASAFADLADTLVKTALRRPTLVVFDEFQQIAAVPNGTAVLRSKLQHHYKEIGLIFAGSAPSAMRDIFANPDQPFLHQADVVAIGPLTLPAAQQIIDGGFAETGRQPGAVASLIHDFTGGHPLRTMQAAHAAWTHAVGVPGDQAWGEALADLRRTRMRTEVSGIYEQLSTVQRKVLRILAHAGSIYGTAANRLELYSKGSAQRARESLLADGHIIEGGNGRDRVTDPFLADWLRRTHPL